MANGSRTMAFQISEELFKRIKAHLERETARTGKKLTQREFVLGLIEAALDKAENEAAHEPEEAGEQYDPQEGESEESGSEEGEAEENDTEQDLTAEEQPA